MTDRANTIEADYLDAQRSFVAFAAGLSEAEWSTGVPCCPGWTVRDVLSHVAGIPDDVLAGRLDGVATDPWTAAQVDRNRSLPTLELLRRWDDQTPGFAAMMQAMQQDRPPIDCHSHEHDIRQALNQPGTRDHPIVTRAVAGMLDGWNGPVPLVVDFLDGSTAGNLDSDGGVVLSAVTPFEVFRSRLGRRSRGQVEAYHWAGEPDQIAAVIDHWFAFGPSESPITE
jgi:hypothetical protein